MLVLLSLMPNQSPEPMRGGAGSSASRLDGFRSRMAQLRMLGDSPAVVRKFHAFPCAVLHDVGFVFVQQAYDVAPVVRRTPPCQLVEDVPQFGVGFVWPPLGCDCYGVDDRFAFHKRYGVLLHYFFSFHKILPSPNQSPEPTAVGAVSSAVAVHAASRRWLSFFR